MRMKYIDVRELMTGFLFITVGLAAAWYASSHYQVGSLRRMGPGFFPAMLGLLMCAFGVLISALSMRKTIHALEVPVLKWRSVLSIGGAILVFSLLLNRAGLVPATIALTYAAVAAERPYHWRRTTIFAASLALIAWLVFSVGLGMNIPAFSWSV